MICCVLGMIVWMSRCKRKIVSKDHIHLPVGYSSNLPVSDLLRRLNGRSTKKLREESSEL